MPPHSRPLPKDYEKSFGSELALNCEYGYKGSELLEMTCMRKEEGALEWEVCGTCECMRNIMLSRLSKKLLLGEREIEREREYGANSGAGWISFEG